MSDEHGRCGTSGPKCPTSRDHMLMCASLVVLPHLRRLIVSRIVPVVRARLAGAGAVRVRVRRGCFKPIGVEVVVGRTEVWAVAEEPLEMLRAPQTPRRLPCALPPGIAPPVDEVDPAPAPEVVRQLPSAPSRAKLHSRKRDVSPCSLFSMSSSPSRSRRSAEACVAPASASLAGQPTFLHRHISL
jgi:hypothetical protein